MLFRLGRFCVTFCLRKSALRARKSDKMINVHSMVDGSKSGLLGLGNKLFNRIVVEFSACCLRNVTAFACALNTFDLHQISR